jgi:hypothetical protein
MVQYKLHITKCSLTIRDMGFLLLQVLGLLPLDVMPVPPTKVEDNVTWASNSYSFLLDGHLMIIPPVMKKWKSCSDTISDDMNFWETHIAIHNIPTTKEKKRK